MTRSIGSAAKAERTLRRTIRGEFGDWMDFALGVRDMAPARHHRMIAAALARLASGESRRLMLMLPPGSAKSSLASLLFPAWWFARHPRSAVIAVSHTGQLAEQFGRGVRGLLTEHGPRLGVLLHPEDRAAGRFATASGGVYFATGVRGAVTGRRADLVVIDDPVRSAADADQFSSREALWAWYRSDLVTRLKPGGRVLLVMTRWHVDDLCGRLLEADEAWDVLRLPALAEQGDPMGREPGEALWPEWEDVAALEAKRRVVGERAFSALFQQSPRGSHGQLFDPRKIVLVDTVPAGTAVRAWDLAATGEGSGNPDWTVGLKLVRDAQGVFFVDDVMRLRGAPAAVVAAIRAAAALDGTAVTIGLPQDPGQAGRAQTMFLTRELAGYRVCSSPETGAKTVRAMPVASQSAVGNLRLRRAAWNAALLDELAEFPAGSKDDQVDALSRAFAMLTEAAAPARFAAVPMIGR